jgi:hypothetical protein
MAQDGLNFLEIEKALRANHLPIYLFAEDRECTTLQCGRGVLVVQDNKKYLLRVCVRRERASAYLDVEKGCHDESTNHGRLMDCGMPVLNNWKTVLTKKKISISHALLSSDFVGSFAVELINKHA